MASKIVIIGIAGSNKDFLLAPFVLKTYLYQFNDIKEKFNIVVKNYHANSNLDIITTDIINLRPDLLCFSCYIWNINIVKQVIQNKRIKSKIVLGGPEISKKDILDGKYDKFNVDYLIFGEGERPFHALLKQKSWSGLAIRDNKTFICSLAYDYLPKLDYKKMPSPYVNTNIDFNIKNLRVNFETQRGCSNRCAYCLYHRNSPIIRYRDPDDVINEIKYVYSHKITVGKIIDANFFSNRKYAKKILNGLINNKIKMRLSVDIVPRFVNNELTELCGQYIDQGGNILAGIGLQSLNEEAMHLINRVTNLIDLDNAVKLLSDAKVSIRIDTILGLPKETKETYFKLLEYVIDKMKHGNHYLGTYLLKILPGTALEEMVEKEKLITNDNQHNLYCTPTIPRKDMLECLRLTAIAFRFFNADNIDKKNKLSTVFLNKSKKNNIELLKVLSEKIIYYLKGTSSNFIKPDFPDAENYYFRKFKEDVSDDVLIEIMKKI